ncbi:hypothetical protein [Nonomuraea fuscirosea]|uniref:hypothetical protein n=1 Tax=Nonomuraea fuscirosea TaxID=1291556 RepID=UPI003406A025
MWRWKVAAVTLALSLLSGGCAERPVEVDPGVLAEVGKIGTVVWKQRQEGLMGSEPVVTYAFLVDVGRDTEGESLKHAIASLHARNWVTSVDDLPRGIWLKSPKWPDAVLDVHMLSASTEYDEPEVKKTIKRQGVKADALVSVYAYHGI